MIRRLRVRLAASRQAKPSFEQVLREAFDAPMLVLSAQALSESLLRTTERGEEFNRGNCR